MLPITELIAAKKGKYRLSVRSATSIPTTTAYVEGGWANMLAHQLPALPPVADFWDVLPDFFAWLARGEAPVELPAVALAAGESVIHGRTLGLDIPNAAQTHLEIIRFAGGNRLCVELDYQGSTRRIEPYSLRRTSEGNIVLTVTADGGQTWVYSYASMQMRPATFVPIVGLFAGGADTRQTMTMLRFGPDGKLIDYTSSAGGVGTASGLAAPATPSAPGPTPQP